MFRVCIDDDLEDTLKSLVKLYGIPRSHFDGLVTES